MFLFYLSVIGVVVVYAAYRYFTRTFNYWKQRNVVGPDPVVLFGNLKESTLRNIPVALVIKKIYDSYPNEKFVGIYRLTTPCLLIRDLDIIKQIMIRDFECFIDRGIEYSKEGLGANMFHSSGDTWRVLRSQFSPLFTSGKLKNMMYLMTEQADTFLEHMESVCCKQPEQEVHALVQKFTMASIASCAFGLDIDLLNDSKSLIKKLDDLIFGTNYANELDMMYPGILKNLNASLFPSEVNAFFNDLVKRVIQLRNGKPTNRKDFMDLILEMRQRGEIQGTERNDNTKLRLELTDDLIAAQAFVFYAGGYETSATTLTYMLYELALNLSIQGKLTKEIDQVLQNHNGELTYDVLNEMTYLDKVFYETLRKYSVVDPLQRTAKMDYTIPGTNLTIKKGQTVLVSIYGVHRDEKYYPNPEVFDPERFDRENAPEWHSCAYLPFGVGPRYCIGSRFAKLQSRVCAVKILSKFRVLPTKNTKRIMKFDPLRIIMSPKGGEYLSFVSRK